MARTRRTPAPGSLGNGKLRRGLGNRTRAAIKPADDAAEQARKERREKTALLRIRHSLDYPEIGRELGISTSQAHRDFQLWKAEQPPSPIAKEVRAEEEPKLLRSLQRLEALVASALKRALDEKTEPAEASELRLEAGRLLKIATQVSESRRKLHGADAPVSQELDVELHGPGGGPVPLEVSKVSHDELLRRLSRLAAAGGEGEDRR